MNIILLENFKKLGNKGDLIKVKSGYARNFLFPKNIAIIASSKNLILFKKNKSNNLLENIKIKKELYNKILNLKKIEIYSKSDKNGKLFGSINSKNIINSIFTELKLKEKKIKLKIISKLPIKNIGTFNIKILISNLDTLNLILNVKNY